MIEPILVARGLSLAYGGTPVVAELDLDVAEGESVALLGPSGSGKTTILSAVAGFIDPMAGELRLRGALVADASRSVPPERRRVGMVFQHYALWPHMTAVETVAYPMLRGGIDRGRARADAAALLERLGLAGLADRRPSELSGGEQQRVGLARAIARDPDLFLFDEPTAHLDTPLRAALQQELVTRRAATGTAALTATHDVAEALAVADRVGLLREGRLVQVGTPAEVYERPVDLWAARLTGPASVIDVMVEDPGDVGRPASVRIGHAVLAIPGIATAPGPRRLLLRPDWVTLGGELPGVVREAWYRGPHTDYRIETPAGSIDVREAGAQRLAVGTAVGWGVRRAWPLVDTER
ncbi:MAG: ABC transporter ATP-binding protein [Chloroflexi bacterium]|nr:ABC transporter ATP-binding protein [Chloroflexota bacterium]